MHLRRDRWPALRELVEYGSARVPPAIGAIDRVNAGLQKEPEEKKR